MIVYSAKSVRTLEILKPFIVTAALLLTALICLAVHACAPAAPIGEIFIIVTIIVGQVVLVNCAESRNLFLCSIMLIGVLLKLTAAWLHVSMAHWGESDAMVYFETATNLAAVSNRYQELLNPQQMWGTEFIFSITACIYKLLGLSFMATTMLYALVSFWGEYLYYLAYREVFPHANPKWAAIALFMWPSIVFWPAALGKDALMLFLLGLTAYSMSKLSKQKTLCMFILLVIGVLGCALIRPHIATLLSISIAAAFFLVKSHPQVSTASHRAVRVLLMTSFSMLALYLCAQLLRVSNIVEAKSRLDLSMQLNQLDGSGFNPGVSLTSKIALSPLLLVRPFPWEVNGSEAGLASAEGILLVMVALFRSGRLVAVLRFARTERFLIFSLWFILLNMILIGMASSNFGLLVRERVMIYPPVLILLLAFSTSEAPIQVNAERRRRTAISDHSTDSQNCIRFS